MSKILVAIPAYNEEESVATVIEQARQVLPGADILVVNDGSTDRTGETAREKQAMVLDLVNNLGIGGALQTAYKFAWRNGYDVVVQIDGDGQHCPGDIPAMLKALEDKECDIVIGARFIGGEGGYKSTSLRRIGIRYFSLLIRVLIGVQIYDPTSGFRACGRAAIERFACNYPADYAAVESIVDCLRCGLRLCEVPVRMAGRNSGVSSIGRGRAVYYMVKVSLAVLFNWVKATKWSKTMSRGRLSYEKNTNNFGG